MNPTSVHPLHLAIVPKTTARARDIAHRSTTSCVSLHLLLSELPSGHRGLCARETGFPICRPGHSISIRLLCFGPLSPFASFSLYFRLPFCSVIDPDLNLDLHMHTGIMIPQIVVREICKKKRTKNANVFPHGTNHICITKSLSTPSLPYTIHVPLPPFLSLFYKPSRSHLFVRPSRIRDTDAQRSVSNRPLPSHPIHPNRAATTTTTTRSQATLPNDTPAMDISLCKQICAPEQC